MLVTVQYYHIDRERGLFNSDRKNTETNSGNTTLDALKFTAHKKMTSLIRGSEKSLVHFH